MVYDINLRLGARNEYSVLVLCAQSRHCYVNLRVRRKFEFQALERAASCLALRGHELQPQQTGFFNCTSRTKYTAHRLRLAHA